MKHIEHNPYRYLGVYSNPPMKERVANQAKMKAFLKVGRQISFPLDMSDLLGPINRTTENVADAIAKLTLPADQIKHAQFWWVKATPMDDIAFNHLTNGNLEMAKSIWEKKVDTSSLQNRIVLSLVQSDYASAIGYAQTLYNNYASSFVSSIVEAGVPLDRTALIHNFIDALIEESFDISQLHNLISDNEWIAYLSEKTVVPLIDRITQAIVIAQTSKGKGPKARYEAGKKLMVSTKDTLKELKTLIPSNDIRYTTIVDKLGIEILQCGIDYYNASSDDDAANKAMTLQNYALSIVVGSLAKERCKENVEILKDIIAKLPPTEVMAEYRVIVDALQRFGMQSHTIANAVILLNSTKPHLQVMKNKLGATNKGYLHWSTIVVSNALGAIIEEVNSAQKDFSTKANEKYYTFDLLMLDVCAVVKAAWKATLIMDTFDMENDFKSNRYNPNRTTLREISNRFNVNTYLNNTYLSNKTSKTRSKSSSSGCVIWLVIIISIVASLIKICNI